MGLLACIQHRYRKNVDLCHLHVPCFNGVDVRPAPALCNSCVGVFGGRTPALICDRESYDFLACCNQLFMLRSFKHSCFCGKSTSQKTFHCVCMQVLILSFIKVVLIIFDFTGYPKKGLALLQMLSMR